MRKEGITKDINLDFIEDFIFEAGLMDGII